MSALLRREGLDWLLYQALQRELRVIMSFIDVGRNEVGGAAQYCSWVDPTLTVTDFLANDTVKVRLPGGQGGQKGARAGGGAKGLLGRGRRAGRAKGVLGQGRRAGRAKGGLGGGGGKVVQLGGP